MTRPTARTVDRSDAPRRRWFRRGPWEAVMMGVIGLGTVMLTQPLVIELYTYSFTVILVGTIGFVVVSHFPD